MPPPPNQTKEDFAKWKVEQLDKVRLRISSTFKYWIENFYSFDFVDERMKDQIDKVIKMMDTVKGGKSYSSIIQRALSKVQEESTKIVTKKRVISTNNVPTA